jgi:hypothetical protein
MVKTSLMRFPAMPTSDKTITGRSGPTANLVPWKPAEANLPMRRRIAGSRIAGLIALVIGLPWLHYSGIHLFGVWESAGFEVGQLLLVLLVLGGLFVTLFGFSQLVYSEQYEIDDSTVTWKRYGLSGWRSWREPLSAYNGVLKDMQRHFKSEADASGYQSRMSYLLYLDHDDDARRVLLYESTNTMESPSPDWDRLWRRYGELFGLPLLEKTSQGVTATDDLDRLLVDRLGDGSVRTPAFDLAAPALRAGLALHKEDSLWVVTVKPVKLLYSGVAFLLIAGLLFGLALYLDWIADRTTAVVLGSIIAAGAILYVLSMRRKFRHPDQVAVDANSLWYRCWNHAEGEWHTDSVPLRDIRRIALARQTNRNELEQVVVESDKRNLEFGARLPAASRWQLRDLLIYLVSLAVK